jgi:hydrogenase maturation protein HypF
VEGTVAGRRLSPYVYRLAREEGLAGYVRNDERGVCSTSRARRGVARFVARLPAEAPPLAAIESVAWTPLPPTGRASSASSTAPAAASRTPR